MAGEQWQTMTRVEDHRNWDVFLWDDSFKHIDLGRGYSPVDLDTRLFVTKMEGREAM